MAWTNVVKSWHADLKLNSKRPLFQTSCSPSLSSSWSTPSCLRLHLREVSAIKISWKTSLWIFGRTDRGHSVALEVTNLHPWLDVCIEGLSPAAIQDLEAGLDTVRTKYGIPYVVKTERIVLEALVGFTFNKKTNFLRVYYETPNCYELIESFLNTDLVLAGKRHKLQMYHTKHFDWVDHFFMMTKLDPQVWVEIQALAIQPRRGSPVTTCHMEGVYHYQPNSIHAVTMEMPVVLSTAMRMRALSSEGMRTGRRLIAKPQNPQDGIVSMAFHVFWTGLKKRDRDVVFYLATSREELSRGHYIRDNILYVPIMNPRMLVQAARTFLVDILDIDVLFYFPDVYRPIEHFCLHGAGDLSKLKNMKPPNFSYAVQFPGRTLFNCQREMQKIPVKPQFDEFTLAAYVQREDVTGMEVSEDFLDIIKYPLDYKQEKEPLLAGLVAELQQLALFESRRNVLLAFLAVSESNCCDLQKCVSNGMQIRVWSRLKQRCYKKHLYIDFQQLKKPCLYLRQSDFNSFVEPPELENLRPRDKIPGYVSAEELKHNANLTNPRTSKKAVQGGYVHQPLVGYYFENWEQTGTLDFSSLYPSIIVGYNICYSNLLFTREDYDACIAAGRDLLYIPLNDMDSVVIVRDAQTMLPELIGEFLRDRKATKKRMQAEQDPFKKAVLNARQLSKKYQQNSIYGFLGVRKGGILPYPVLMGIVCSIGRWMNLTTKYIAIHEFAASVVYGDTDSIMVQIGISSEELKDIPDTGDEALRYRTAAYRKFEAICERVSSEFPPPNKLEFEGVKSPFLLVAKKNYAYTCWSEKNPAKSDGYAISGLGGLKRDRCHWVRNLTNQLVPLLMNGRPATEAKPLIEKAFQDLLENKVELKDLVITCAMQDEKDYSHDRLIQVRTARKEAKRTGMPVLPGTRLKYVVREPKYTNEPFMDRGVTIPIFLENKMEIDKEFYIKSQMASTLTTLLQFHTHQYNVQTTIDHFVQAVLRKRMSAGCKLISQFFPKRQKIK